MFTFRYSYMSNFRFRRFFIIFFIKINICAWLYINGPLFDCAMIWLKGVFISKLLNNPPALYILIFHYHTLHNSIKVLVFIFCFYNSRIFTFYIFSKLQTIRKHCFINKLKSLIHSLNLETFISSFILSYCSSPFFIKTNSHDQYTNHIKF